MTQASTDAFVDDIRDRGTAEDLPRNAPPPVGPPVQAPHRRVPSVLERLRDPMPTDRLAGWVTTLTITVIAFLLRLYHLGYPNTLVFDETYYAKDAYSLLKFGYEREWPSDANAKITAGNVDVYQDGPSFIVHPQLGKWLIALGEKAFGMNSFGWRISACVFGALLVFMTIRLTRRVARSTLIGGIAGVLLTFDGLAFVMSRIALLDIFQAFFIVTAVACLVADRDYFRNRLADHLEKAGLTELPHRFGPLLWWRPWRLAAWVAFGLALGVKWNTIYVMAAFGVLCVFWDVGARRLAGAGGMSALGLFVDGIPAAVSMAVLSFGVYLATWTSWLMTPGGWDRDWGATHPEARSVKLLGPALASLWKYHQDIYDFHRGDFITKATHAYDAKPWGWLILARPIGIDAVNDIQPGQEGCSVPQGETCLRVISGIGTPVLWWGALICLIIAVVLWIGARDWRFGLAVVGVLSAWLPWFQYTDRPQFFFYAILIIPFSVLATSLCLGKLLGPPGRPRVKPALIVGGFVALVIANFAYLYPILTDALLPYDAWLRRMWFRTWI